MYVFGVEKLRFHDDHLDDESESGFPLTTTFFNNHSCLSESSYLSMACVNLSLTILVHRSIQETYAYT